MNALEAPRAHEIRGPSAYGGGFQRFWSLVWLIAFTDFRLAYFGSVLGYLWSLVQPLALFGALYVVFNHILRVGSHVPHYAVLLLLNIVLYRFFQDATSTSVTSVVNRESLVRKMQFPRLVIPLAVVTTQVLNLLLNLVAVVVFLLASGISPRLSWLALAPLLVILTIFAAGVSMVLSSIYVTYRDVVHIWGLFVTVLFYATPVLYVADRTHGALHKLQLANPLAAILTQARRWVVDPHAPSFAHAIGGFPWTLLPWAILLVVCAFGLWIFNHEAPRIAERL